MTVPSTMPVRRSSSNMGMASSAGSAANEKTSEKDSPSWTECARRRLTVVGHGGSAHVMQYAICCGLLNLTRTLLFVGSCNMHSRQLPQGINRQLALAALHALSNATY